MLRSHILMILSVTLVGARQSSANLCSYYKREMPEFYKVFCPHGGSSSSKPAGANSTFADGFNLNAASLPTDPSSLGVETIGSSIRDRSGQWSPTFSIIKGFHKFGTGISTGSNNTFYGNDVIQRESGPSSIDSFEPHEPAQGQLVNLNLGTAFELIRMSHGPSIQLGVSARYNKTTDTWGGGPAVMAAWTHLTLGAGYTRERVSNFMPRITFMNTIASTRLSIFELEYNYLRNIEGPVLSPIQIITLTATLRRLTLTAATRRLNYLQEGTVVQNHFGIQYLFSKSFSAGFLFNYIPGTSSIGTQIYL